jgi:small-conductance mechanosensitive channel
MGGTGLSRTRTLLPLLKRTVQITLSVISTMIILASLGVDIAPLLAGAGVVGLAIGFGSQTLVRDVVSGAFFLIDDAFRIGEYVDVGAAKGIVEKMSVRSLRLRHHRGAVHTVPFGEVKTLSNYSRDWAIMKLKLRVPFDTDIDKVRKLLKAVGQELAQNEDIKDDFIMPFKSQGAVEVCDYGFVINTKFMSKPGKQFVIRRHAFNAVQKAFKENGIEFATPKVEVTVGGDDEVKHPDRKSAKAKPPTSRRRRSVAGAAAGRAARAAKPVQAA